MENKESIGKVGMEAFNVVKKSNEGVTLPLSLPDGTKTDEYLVVLGADSQKFQEAVSIAYSEKAKLRTSIDDEKISVDDAAKQTEEINRRMVSALVIDWSFDETCNGTNVCKFFHDAPQIQDAVNLYAGDRSNFFDLPPRS